MTTDYFKYIRMVYDLTDKGIPLEQAERIAQKKTGYKPKPKDTP